VSEDVTHREIAAQVAAGREETAALRREVEKLTETVEKLVELSETYTAIKTGGRFIAWMAKFLAGLLAIWVLIKGGAQFLVELGKP